MDQEQLSHLDKVIIAILGRNMLPDAFQWLQEKGQSVRGEKTTTTLYNAFPAVPRKTGRRVLEITGTEAAQITFLQRGFSINDWTLDRLARLWLLMQVDADDQGVYLKKIGDLFRNAEMNELVALYSALPVYRYPEAWVSLTAAGVRSNIGSVLEAIMYHNPYPEMYLDEAAWNQLIVKAYFTDKDISKIIGLDERANERLADILLDYAHERQAAGRTVPPALWRLVYHFFNEKHLEDLTRLLASDQPAEQRAGALACYHTSFPPAQKLLSDKPHFIDLIRNNVLRWDTLGN